MGGLQIIKVEVDLDRSRYNFIHVTGEKVEGMGTDGGRLVNLV